MTHDAVVHVFSKSVGERDARQLCNVTAHEVGHAMGLDHSMQCGDVMSYPREDCGFGRAETFVDADAPCGEYAERSCHTGEATQNSFQRLAVLVGLRHAVEPDESFERSTSSEPTVEPPPSIYEQPSAELGDSYVPDASNETDNAYSPEASDAPGTDDAFTPGAGNTPDVEQSQQRPSPRAAAPIPRAPLPLGASRRSGCSPTGCRPTSEHGVGGALPQPSSERSVGGAGTKPLAQRPSRHSDRAVSAVTAA